MKKESNPLPPVGAIKPPPPPVPPKKGGSILASDLKVNPIGEKWVSREWLSCKKCGEIFECWGFPSLFHSCEGK